ncbi:MULTISPECIES: ATP-dependent DNA ligase [Bradyrhizobium]|uniref:ATP-dependent DNA ligase n=1 Tax=Bradyrhizobium TaxID=374 RepID=UPI000231CCE4|nr:hypothetical protein [Bradyrhizobium japonicum]BAL08514.1 hypothetical protein BJ6T_32400 [Bradyrhizobium japonicum USDA 6]MCS3533172.1 hypothetical protein [Bradyrhizobium japonicum]MCS3990734.1 hypothetical protein [Bradyrhizobium japonicum]MCS4014455.1 hypothetical protein [Bradyrhizobium japonicum]MCS4210461.1 hypothetical protein [Bradyrhizobium japonicum]
MSKAFESCLPTAAKVMPASPDWIHVIKYDGYRLRVERKGRDVRLLTKNGHNRTDRFPWIVEAALKNREQQFVIDGEAVVFGVDGVSDFNALHSRRHDGEVQLYAFDILALGGEDLRQLPLTMRKTNLSRLLRGRPDGIFIAPFEGERLGRTFSRQPVAWASRPGLETPRPALWRRPLERLDQVEEPDQSGNDARMLSVRSRASCAIGARGSIAPFRPSPFLGPSVGCGQRSVYRTLLQQWSATSQTEASRLFRSQAHLVKDPVR